MGRYASGSKAFGISNIKLPIAKMKEKILIVKTKYLNLKMKKIFSTKKSEKDF